MHGTAAAAKVLEKGVEQQWTCDIAQHAKLTSGIKKDSHIRRCKHN